LRYSVINVDVDKKDKKAGKDEKSREADRAEKKKDKVVINLTCYYHFLMLLWFKQHWNQ
jgi:hypothetical protein